MQILIKCGYLVTGMPKDRPGCKYFGVDTEVWPNDITPEALENEMEKAYMDLTYPVLLNEHDALQYYFNCIEAQIPARLLYCQCGREPFDGKAQKLPHKLQLKELGYDYAYPSGDYFSSILNETLYGKSKLPAEWAGRLNQYGLLASQSDATAYIKRRKQLEQEYGEHSMMLEKGNFGVFHLFEVKLPPISMMPTVSG